MDKINISKELESPEYKLEYEKNLDITNSFIQCLFFVYVNCGRNEKIKNSLFFLQVIDDMFQSIAAIKMLSSEGIRNTCRREFRYLIELAIKAGYISQKHSEKTVEEQLSDYEKELKTASISMINDINLYFLSENNKVNFLNDVKRIYGEMCLFVHSTPEQMQERIELAYRGRTIGLEGIQELNELNNEMRKVYSYILILIFHSIPSWCVGEYLVERDGSTVNTYFTKSKYFAEIDEQFDYKHERQDKLKEINNKRKENIEF